MTPTPNKSLKAADAALSVFDRVGDSLLANFIIVALVFAVQPLNADQIDTYIAHYLKEQPVPGLSLAVLRNGKVIKSRGYGLASAELNAPATPRTAYQLASDTKQFTATAIMLLVQDGRVRLSDSITNYLLRGQTGEKSRTVFG